MRTSLALTDSPIATAVQALFLSFVAAILPGSLYVQQASTDAADEEYFEEISAIGARQTVLGIL